MATYNITSPDGQTYKVTAPDTATEAEVLAYAQKNFSMAAKPAPKETTLAQDVKQGVGNLLAGAVRGAGSIGATLLRPFDTAAENEARRKAMDEGLRLLGAEPESWMYQGGKLGGEIAGTAGAGGAIARGLGAIPGVAAKAGPLLQAIGSSGMTAGGAGMGTRIAGGAVTGGASAALVNPNDAMTGAVIGGALPPVLKGAGFLGAKARAGINNAFLSEDAATARRIAEIAGAKTKDEIGAIRSALATPRPSNIGVNLTAPQILQNEGVSQLQRSLQNMGDTAITRRTAENQRALMDTLNRISPVSGTLQDTAQDAGNAIAGFTKNAERAESARIGKMFDAVDPFDEVRVTLPIDQMAAQRAKYLGRGTFGMGAKADEAIRTAENIGTQTMESIAPTKVAREQTLLQAVKKAGGINPNSLSSRELSGEIRDLKQSGLGRLTNAKSGKSIEKLAEDMYQRGFIPDEDPATLIDALRAGGDDVVMGGGESAYRAAMERSMGDMPEGAAKMPVPVSFKDLQTLRSSIGSAADEIAATPGARSELAALRGMKQELDDAVERLAQGGGEAGDYFPADIVQSWRAANAEHAAKKARFNTGPQSRIFARGADKMPAVQGAEVPRLFFNALRSQTDDIASFNRLTQGDSAMADELKKYAIASASQNVDALGNLTNAKFGNWAKGHSGAIGGLFGPSDKAALDEIAKYLKTADSAERLNMAKGSNTMQNINAAISSGLLENPLVSFAANKLPVLKSVAGPVLESLKTTAKQKKAEKIGGLLADPELLGAALDDLMMLKSGSLIGMSPRNQALINMGIARTAPVLAAQ